MRRIVTCWVVAVFCAAALSASAASGRVIKVLPFLVDTNGQHTLTPDLFERDGYQDLLRRHPARVSTMLFEVQWKVKGEPAGPLKLRLELRGEPREGAATGAILEEPVQPKGRFSRWTGLSLAAARYKELGTLTAWRATLWEGDRLLDEQKSFLW